MVYVVIDVETTKVPRHLPWIEGSYLVSLHLKKANQSPKNWLFNHPESVKSFKENVAEIQAELDNVSLLVNHNLKFDVNWFESIGLTVQQLEHFCTMTAEYLIQGQKIIMPSLATCCSIYGLEGKQDKVKEMWDAGYETDQIPADILLPYGDQDVVATEAVFILQQAALKKQGLTKLFKVQMEAGKLFGRAERAGLNINVRTLQKHSATYAKEIDILTTKLNTLSKNQIQNWGSPDQRSCFFFGGNYNTKLSVEEYDNLTQIEQEKFTIIKKGRIWVQVKRHVVGLGFIPPKGSEAKKPGFYKTGAGIVAGLRCSTPEQRKALKFIAERNRKSKIKSTYLDGLPKKVQSDGLVHPNYNQSKTITGRPSSSDPNGQNFPRDKTGPVKIAIETRF